MNTTTVAILFVIAFVSAVAGCILFFKIHKLRRLHSENLLSNPEIGQQYLQKSQKLNYIILPISLILMASAGTIYFNHFVSLIENATHTVTQSDITNEFDFSKYDDTLNGGFTPAFKAHIQQNISVNAFDKNAYWNYYLASIYDQENKFDSAIVLLEHNIPHIDRPDYKAIARKLLARCIYKNGDLAKGKQMFDRLLKDYPSDGLLYNDYAIYYYEQSQFDSAVTLGLKSIEFDRENPVLYANLSLYFDQLGKRKQRNYFYNKAVEFGYMQSELDQLKELYSLSSNEL